MHRVSGASASVTPPANPGAGPKPNAYPAEGTVAEPYDWYAWIEEQAAAVESFDTLDRGDVNQFKAILDHLKGMFSGAATVGLADNLQKAVTVGSTNSRVDAATNNGVYSSRNAATGGNQAAVVASDSGDATVDENDGVNSLVAGAEAFSVNQYVEQATALASLSALLSGAATYLVKQAAIVASESCNAIGDSSKQATNAGTFAAKSSTVQGTQAAVVASDAAHVDGVNSGVFASSSDGTAFANASGNESAVVASRGTTGTQNSTASGDQALVGGSIGGIASGNRCVVLASDTYTCADNDTVAGGNSGTKKWSLGSSSGDGYLAGDLECAGTVVSFANLPTGATQVAAGAAAGELWVTSGHASLDDNLVMFGV